MARYARSQGKGPKKSKRDKLKASAHYTSISERRGDKVRAKTKVTLKNDGDPHVYADKKFTEIKGGTSTSGRTRVKTKNPKYANPLKGKPKGATKTKVEGGKISKYSDRKSYGDKHPGNIHDDNKKSYKKQKNKK
jgi:hypothetical protein